MRLGKGEQKVPKCADATGSTLIYYTCDATPDFHMYESADTALNILAITHSNKSRMIQCLTKVGSDGVFDDVS